MLPTRPANNVTAHEPLSSPLALARQLTKTFPSRGWCFWKSIPIAALAPLDFSMKTGETVALLGRNGSGKSTLIKLLAGIIQPTAGECTLFGKCPSARFVRENISLLSGNRSRLWENLTIYRSITLHGQLYGLRQAQQTQWLEEWLERLEIKDYLNRYPRELSLGQRMRCELVLALLHHPKLLLADEPTLGLDLVAKIQLRSIIRQWCQEQKMSLILTSHDCADVEALCSRTLLLEKGHLRYDGDLNRLMQHWSEIRYLTLSFSQRVSRHFAQKNIPFDRLPTQDPYHLKVKLDLKQSSIAALLAQLTQACSETLVDLKVESVSLEQVIESLFTSATDIASFQK